MEQMEKVLPQARLDCEAFVELLDQEQQALIDRDMAELEKLLAAKAPLVDALARHVAQGLAHLLHAMQANHVLAMPLHLVDVTIDVTIDDDGAPTSRQLREWADHAVDRLRRLVDELRVLRRWKDHASRKWPRGPVA